MYDYETTVTTTADQTELLDCSAVQIVAQAAELARLQAHIDQVEAMAAEGHAALVREQEVRAYHENQREIWRQNASRSEANHRQDIATIGDELRSQAERRDWCSEYDQIVESLNSQLHVELETRTRDYNVRLYTTVSVTASSASQAREMVNDGEVDIDDWEIDEVYES